ncbi:hypothetical protein [Anaerocaecibacter muris]|uniref:hypothetical protein n=1 Tax=Anaerocaecibacter muris TaxID=2941513 RepID=UPI003F6911FF
MDSVSETSDRRMRGFAEALKPRGKSFDFMPCEDPKEMGHLACEKIASADRFCFLFFRFVRDCCCYCTSKRTGLPIKWVVCGYDNLHNIIRLFRKIKSVEYDLDAIGRLFVFLLIQKIQGEIDSEEKVKKMFDVKLVD